MRREPISMSIALLKAVREEHLITRIIRRANINYNMAKPMLSALLKSSLIVRLPAEGFGPHDLFAITVKGNELLEEWARIEEQVTPVEERMLLA